MRRGRNGEVRVGEQAAQGVLEGSVPIRRFGVCVLPRSHLLIPLRRKVNVKVVERSSFDVIGVLVAPAIVAAKSKHLIRRGFMSNLARPSSPRLGMVLPEGAIAFRNFRQIVVDDSLLAPERTRHLAAAYGDDLYLLDVSG